VPFDHEIIQVICSDEFTLVQTKDYRIFASGENSFGQLGMYYILLTMKGLVVLTQRLAYFKLILVLIESSQYRVQN
jgi:alpha-tubulin suppressor-like RCC1 family protein